MPTKDDWKKARAEFDELEARRADMVHDIKLAFEQERDRRWAKTNTRYQNLKAKLDEIEGEIGEPFGFCEGCSEPLFGGDLYHGGIDVYLCQECAPSYADLLTSYDNFRGRDDEDPMTKEEAQAICDAHVAAGGSLEDKMVHPL